MNDTQEITRASDIGTPELHRQLAGGIINKVTHEGQRRAYNAIQTPIDYYLNQNTINQKQWEAGNEFYRLWYYGAEKGRYVTIDLSREPRGLPNYEALEIMEQKYNNASRAMRSTVTALVVFGVCCVGQWANAIQVEIAPRRRIILLRDGLDDLAKHFGFQN